MNVQVFNRPFAKSFWLQTAVLVGVNRCADCCCGEVRLVTTLLAAITAARYGAELNTRPVDKCHG